MSKDPDKSIYTPEDKANYTRLMLTTNAIYRNNDPEEKYPKSSKSDKWKELLRHIWFATKFEGKGVVVIPSDPNALLERQDLLLASKEAGHTGVGNELVSI